MAIVLKRHRWRGLIEHGRIPTLALPTLDYPSQSFLSRVGRPMSIAEDREPIPELIG